MPKRQRIDDIDKLSALQSKSNKKKAITEKDVLAAEKKHVADMSDPEYYTALWNFSAFNTGYVVATPILFAQNSLVSKVKKEISIDILVGARSLKDFINSYASKQKVVFPIGYLYTKTTAKVHWNAFIRDVNGKITRVDPAQSTCEPATYAYSETVVNAFKPSVPELLALDNSCQVNECGRDGFCQTWIAFVASMIIHGVDSGRIRQYAFRETGYFLLKMWIQCAYKSIKISFDKAPTYSWYNHTKLDKERRALFYYTDSDDVVKELPPTDPKKGCHNLIINPRQK
jgi:hypothetical protein